MTNKRAATICTLVLASVAGLFVLAVHPAAGQDPAMQATVDAYATGLSTCDLNGLASCTTPAFHARLRPRLATCSMGQLGTFRRVPVETQLEPGLVQCTLVQTHPDGVETAVAITVKRDGSRWVVVGGAVP